MLARLMLFVGVILGIVVVTCYYTFPVEHFRELSENEASGIYMDAP